MKVGAQVWRLAYVVVLAACLSLVATYYHPDFGFTAFIEFPLSNHENEIAAVRNAPHYDHADSGGYDGQFYAQLAVEPLLGDRALDTALDTPPYRARRILMSWASYLVGLGRPTAILQVYAVHAVVAWVFLAWLVTRWIEPTTGKGFVLAATALLAHGPLMAIRYALPDLAAAVLVALAVLAAEKAEAGRARGRIRAWPGVGSAMLLGAAGLTRDTALSACTMFLRLVGRSPLSWLRVAALGLVAAAPLLIWVDYIYAIYRTTTFAGSDHFVAPLSAIAWKVGTIWSAVATGGLRATAVDDIATLAAFTAQAAWLVYLLVRHRDTSFWVLAGLGYVALAAVTDPPVWEGSPGAYPRIFMPVMLAAHVTLARRGGPWWLVLLVGLDVIAGLRLLGGGF